MNQQLKGNTNVFDPSKMNLREITSSNPLQASNYELLSYLANVNGTKAPPEPSELELAYDMDQVNKRQRLAETKQAENALRQAALNSGETPTLQAGDGDGVNEVFSNGHVNPVRLVGSKGSSFDAYETEKAKFDPFGDAIKVSKLNERKLEKQRAAIDQDNKWEAGTATNEDVYARGNDGAANLRAALDNGGSLQKQGTGYYGRDLATLETEEGNYADAANNPKNNADYNSPYNAQPRMRIESKASEKKTSLNKKAGRVTDADLDTWWGATTNNLLAAQSGIETGVEKLMNVVPTAVSMGMNSAVSDGARAMYADVKAAMDAGKQLSPDQQAFVDAENTIEPGTSLKDGVAMDREVLSPYKMLDVANKADDIVDYNKEVSKSHGSDRVNRSQLDAQAADLEGKSTQAGKEWDKGDYFGAGMTLLKGTGEALVDHPAASITMALESLPEVAGYVLAAPAMIAANISDRSNKGVEAFKQNHEGKYPDSDEMGIIVATSVAATAIDKVGADIIGSALKGGGLKEIAKVLTRKDKQVLLESAKTLGVSVAKLMTSVVAGMATEFVEEGSTNLLEQYAGTQDAGKLDLIQTYVAAGQGAASGGMMKGAMDSTRIVPQALGAVVDAGVAVSDMRSENNNGKYKVDADPVVNLRNLASDDFAINNPDMTPQAQATAMNTELGRLRDEMAKETDDESFGKLKRHYDKQAATVKEWEQAQAIKVIDGVKGTTDPVEQAKGLGTIMTYGSDTGSVVDKLPDIDTTLIDDYAAKRAAMPDQSVLADTIDNEGSTGLDGHLKTINAAMEADDRTATVERIAKLTEYRDSIEDQQHKDVVTAGITAIQSIADTVVPDVNAQELGVLQAKDPDVPDVDVRAAFNNQDLQGLGESITNADPDIAGVANESAQASADANPNMTQDEAMIHQVAYATWDSGMKLKPTVAVKMRKLVKLAQRALGRAGYKVFMTDGVDADGAKAIYDRIFNGENTLTEFATHMLTNKVLRDAVGNTKAGNGKTLAGVVKSLSDQVTQLTGKLMGRKIGNRTISTEVNKLAAAVNQAIYDNQNQKQNKAVEMAKAGIRHTVNVITKPYTAFVDNYLQEKPSTSIKKGLTAAAQAVGLTRDNEVYKLAKELQGADIHTLPWGKLLRQGRADKDLQNVYADETARLVQGSFVSEVPKKTWEAITEVMLKSEMHTLTEHFTSDEIVGLLRGDMQDVIDNMVAQLDADSITLAQEAGSGTRAHNLRENPGAEILATFYALQSASAESKAAVADLMESEYADDAESNGITRVLELHKDYRGSTFGSLIHSGVDDRRTKGIVRPLANVTDPTISQQAHEVLGRMVGNEVGKPKRKAMSQLVLQQAKDDFDQYYGDDPKRFVKLSADSDNPKHRELHRLFIANNTDVGAIWGNGDVYLQEGLLDLVYGYQKLGATKHLPKLLAPLAESMVKAHEATVRFAKRSIVKYTPEVIMNNIGSNVISTTLALGVSPVKVVKLQQEAVGLINDYREMQGEIAQLHITGKNPERVAQLSTQMMESPIHLLAEEGMISGKVEDIADDGFIKGVHSRSVENITDLSDPAARYAAYQIMVNEKGMSHEDAIQRAADLFVNYDSPLSPGLQYLDDKGILPFMKYLLRVQRVVMRTMRENPLGSVSLELLDRGIAELPDIQDGALPLKAGINRVNTPVDTVTDAMELPIFRMMGLFN